MLYLVSSLFLSIHQYVTAMDCNLIMLPLVKDGPKFPNILHRQAIWIQSVTLMFTDYFEQNGTTMLKTFLNPKRG